MDYVTLFQGLFITTLQTLLLERGKWDTLGRRLDLTVVPCLYLKAKNATINANVIHFG